MAVYFSRRKLKPKEPEESGELNIVPYLDILMNLIIFMLLSMTGLAAFGILSVNAPAEAGASAGGETQQELMLAVMISKKGFFVSENGAFLPPPSGSAEGSATVPPGSGGVMDYAALNARLKSVKERYPTLKKVHLAADPDTAYEVLVHTMDAVREMAPGKTPLFPEVVLGAL